MVLSEASHVLDFTFLNADMSVTEDWLTDEKFDFDVSASPVGGNAGLLDEDGKGSDEDDEEVFFGPRSHTEKCIATVVKEQEEKDKSFEHLNPEEQALLLRESALLSLMIKHGTPNSSRPSPVAVVHPMKRYIDDKELCEMLTKENTFVMKGGKEEKRLCEENNIRIMNKENLIENNGRDIFQNNKPNNNVSKLKMSKILQPRYTSKTRPASQPEGVATKLPVSKSRGKIQSEFSEPLVDQATLYGLVKDIPQKQEQNKSVRRRSGLPNRKPSDSNIQKPKGIPSLLPSAVPLTRSRAASAVNADQKGKPLKALNHGISGLPQPQLRLPSARKSIASQGTPSQIGKPSGIASLKRQPSNDFKRASTARTPSRKSIATNKTQEPATRMNDLVTPVQRTPSTRKSIAGRQLLGKTQDISRTPSPAESIETEPGEISDARNATTGLVEIQNVTKATLENTQVPPEITQPPSHSDILNRYKKLCGSRKESSVSTVENVNEATLKENDNKMSTVGEIEMTDVNPTYADASNEPVESKKVEVIEQQPAVTLVEICDEKSLLDLSPVRTKENFIDPFKTGHTPPPLIDIGDVLQPERPLEMNLIEF